MRYIVASLNRCVARLHAQGCMLFASSHVYFTDIFGIRAVGGTHKDSEDGIDSDHEYYDIHLD